jgi:prepilin-type N-terminal cleavage/methylation domain-containing protein
MRARRSAPAAGFTLIEVLLTLFIMSFMLLAMTQILNAARISRDTIHNIQENQLAGPKILDLIEADLRGISVFGRTRAQHLRVKDRVILGLDADSIDFVTTTDSLVLQEAGDRYVRADVNEVGYRLRPSAESDDFLEIYRRESFGVDSEPFDGGRYTFLHGRVKSLDIQVYAEDGVDAEPLEEWATHAGAEDIGLPRRVEIALVLELAPRIAREQLLIAPVDKRTVTYRRVLRLPESLRALEKDEDVPILTVPNAPPVPVQAGPGGVPPPDIGGGGGGGGGGGFGGGGGSGKPQPGSQKIHTTGGG